MRKRRNRMKRGKGARRRTGQMRKRKRKTQKQSKTKKKRQRGEENPENRGAKDPESKGADDLREKYPSWWDKEDAREKLITLGNVSRTKRRPTLRNPSYWNYLKSGDGEDAEVNITVKKSVQLLRTPTQYWPASVLILVKREDYSRGSEEIYQQSGKQCIGHGKSFKFPENHACQSLQIIARG